MGRKHAEDHPDQMLLSVSYFCQDYGKPLGSFSYFCQYYGKPLGQKHGSGLEVSPIFYKSIQH